MKTHFVSNIRQSACGTFNPKKYTQDHPSVTCSRCQSVIEAAAKTGRMLFEENKP